MNYLWVAYNGYGDLVAEAYSYESLMSRIRNRGYDEDECFIGRVSS